jgi:hypothetical protein
MDDRPDIDLDAAYAKIERAEAAAFTAAGARTRRHCKSASHRPIPTTGSSGDIASAVEAIPNDDVDWKEWRDTGLAIWAATRGSADGLLIFKRWSAKSIKYDENETEKAWDEFAASPPDRVGAGSLFRRARLAQPSWRKPSEDPPPHDRVPEGPGMPR